MDYPLRLVNQLRAHLQALRKLRGLTQARLGTRLGLSQVRIAEIEANPGVVSVDQLARILSALDAMLVLRDLAVDPVPPSAEDAQAPSTPARGQRRAGAKDSRASSLPVKKSAARVRASSTATTPSLKPRKGSW